MKSLFFWLAFIFGFLSPILLFSQQYNFRYLSVENGLAQSQVLSLCQDSKGNIWIGTYGGGLNKFDGIDFTLYTIAEGLQSNTITSIFEDSKKHLWVGSSNGGVSRFNGKSFDKIISAKISVLSINEDKNGVIFIGTEKNGVFTIIRSTLLPVPQLDFLIGNPIHAILKDKNNNLLFATEKSGIYFYTGKSIKNITTHDGLPTNTVKCLVQDNNGIYWFGTASGLCKYDGNTIKTITPDNNKFLNTTSLHIGINNILWIGTFGEGLLKYRDGIFSTYRYNEGLKGDYINCIISENTGTICIGTDGDGLCRFEGERFRYFTKSNGLSNNVIMGIYQDSKGRYWLGTYGGGVCLYFNGQFTYFTKKEGLCDDIIYSITEDHEGNIWLGSKTNGISCYNEKHEALSSTKKIQSGSKSFTNYSTKNGLCSNIITNIITDKKGNIWIATRNGGVNKYDGKIFTTISTKDGLSSDNIVTLYADKSDNIWVGSEEGDIDIIYQRETLVVKKSKKLNSCIYAIVEDKSGLIWVGTQDNGIYAYDGSVYHNYTTKNGLTNDFVYAMIFDEQNNLWVSSSKGVDKITFHDNFQDFTVKNYGTKEGFTGIENNMHAVLKDVNNNIWFGTVNGLMIYNPNADAPNTYKPKVSITDILLFFQKNDLKKYSSNIDSITLLPKNLRLPYNKNYITFKFIGIDISNPEGVRYTWKLDGFDDEWTPLMSQREVVYSNLPPGEYTFLIKAFNESGIGNDTPVSFQFVIVPPFWKTWTFRIILTLLLLAIVYFYYRRRITSLERIKEKLEKIVRERTEEIYQQKNEIVFKNKKLESINKELEKLSIVARETDNAVLIMNKDANFEWLNEGFKRMYEYSQEDVDSMRGTSILKISTYPEIKKMLACCYESKLSISYEAPAITRSGKNIWTHTTITPILDESNNIIKLVAIDSDITRLKATEEYLKEEKEKSDNLLRNILPAETAAELKEKGSATPRYYKCATVAFTDFKGFTLLCETITPRELVDELQTYFANFDEIIEQYSLEKIKTIGDSYMYAGGLPAENRTHPTMVVLASLKIIAFVNNKNIEKQLANKEEWHLRIGVHAGEVITGVVGKKKFAYDIWGDTVNVASRMESAGVPDVVNVSAQTYELIKEYFNCTYRGDIDIKHKKKMGMYLVDAIKPEYSVDEKGIEPNTKLLQLLDLTKQIL